MVNLRFWHHLLLCPKKVYDSNWYVYSPDSSIASCNKPLSHREGSLCMDPDRIFEDQPFGKVLTGNCVALMDQMAPGSADLIFADPPYNLQLQGELKRPNHTKVVGVSEDWDKFLGFADYDEFTRSWLIAAQRLLSDSGSLWVMGSYHNIFRIGSILQDLGFWILNDVIWRKTNPMPNFRGRRFANAHETLIWCVKSKDNKGYTFNYQALKMLNEDLQMRSDWSLPICSGSERLRNGDETAHPTQKPEALLYRLILGTSNPGDLVVDPFFGTGTTGAVAKELGRKYIGIEQDPKYSLMARERLIRVEPRCGGDIEITPSKRTQRRVPFGNLVERGLLSPGAILYDHSRRLTARIRADGSLVAGGVTGSIQGVAASLQGAPSCNGWTFWFYEDAGQLVPIDILRQKVRAELVSLGTG